MHKLQANSYWYKEKDERGEEILRVMCVGCFNEHVYDKDKVEIISFWNGAKMGYGDYDCWCSICDNAINIREEKNA